MNRAIAAILSVLLVTVTATIAADAPATGAAPLPHTGRLEIQGDIASQMIEGIDRFLLKQTQHAADERAKAWDTRKPHWSGADLDFSSPEAFEKSIQPHRRRLAHILGVRDERPAKVAMELVATVNEPALVGRSEEIEAYAIRWRAFGDVSGEGLLLKSARPNREAIADVIAIPDADQTPEMIAGLTPGIPPEQQFARRLAESGCRVIVPVLIDRRVEKRVAPGRTSGPELSSREFVQRSAYVLGRHILGYELQKVLAAVDWCKGQSASQRIGVIGHGEGGLLALYASAIDPRIDVAGVSGYLGQPRAMWEQPLERNVFGLSQRFDDALLIAMTWPRSLVGDYCSGPVVKVTGKDAAPGRLDPCIIQRPAVETILRSDLAPDDMNAILAATVLVAENRPAPRFAAAGKKEPTGDVGSEKGLAFFLNFIARPAKLAPVGPAPQHARKAFDPLPRQKRQLAELVRHNEQVLAGCGDARWRALLQKVDTSSPEKYEASIKALRETFCSDVMGRFDLPLATPNARSRQIYDTPEYTGHEVVLDVYEDVMAYGILLLPRGMKEGEKRPVVVCQHGLEGRPTDTIVGDHRAYHDYAAQLCKRGFIVFAPQNPYIFTDRFRTLVRKAHPLGKGLWSIIIPQHQQILNFLKAQPNVDGSRIAFYGLSYGGKTAMRVPAALTDYCLSICSGDFNEWVYKNAATSVPWSYVYTGEYEIFEWDLGNTFNYAEMAALIAPRPFMVERGHFDGVGVDEYVAFEFAKVRNLYNARLKLPPDRCQIEWFSGPHTINGQGTFEFLQKHLRWEKK